MNHHPFFRALCCLCAILLCPFALHSAESEVSRTVTVEECLRRVMEQSLEIKSGSYKTQAATHRARQAARPLNPRLETEIENVAGSGANEGFNAAETTVSLSQEFELGDKRRYRADVANYETEVSLYEQEVRVRILLFQTRLAALTVQAAQERLRLATEALALARETESVAETREQAGVTTVLETERARSETVKAVAELEERHSEQRDAVRELALCWGEIEPSFDAVDNASFAELSPLPPLDQLLESAASNPETLAAETQFRSYNARIGVERAALIPNLELSAGLRRFQEGDDYALVVGAGIELPFFTRNQDGVRAAEAEAESVRLDAITARLKREGQIRRIFARLNTLAEKRVRLDKTVMPATMRTLSLVNEAHQQGKALYLDVLEARRALVETRLQIIESITEYQTMNIELGRLTNTLPQTL